VQPSSLGHRGFVALTLPSHSWQRPRHALLLAGEALLLAGEALLLAGEALVVLEALLLAGEALVVLEALLLAGEALVVLVLAGAPLLLQELRVHGSFAALLVAVGNSYGASVRRRDSTSHLGGP
jgi:hypothetical protein